MSEEQISVEELQKATAPEVRPHPETEIAPEVGESSALEAPEVVEAAKQYATLSKEIRGRAKNMKAGGLARVLVAYAEFPYSQTYPKFVATTESDLFLLMLSNAKAKGIISNALKSETMHLEQLAVGNVTNDILENISKKGEENGKVDEGRDTKEN